MWNGISLLWLLTGLIIVGGYLALDDGAAFVAALLADLVWVLPLACVVAVLAGWLAASPLSQRMVEALGRRPLRGIVVASLTGALSVNVVVT